MKILPVLRRIFSTKAVKVGKPTFTAPKVTIAEPIRLETPVKAEENPYLEYIYKMYEREGVSRDIVSRVVLRGEKQRFYRYVGEEELNKLLTCQRVTSNRPCHGGNLTDVTSNPNYGKIPTIGKYRLTFKDKPEFAPFPLTKDSLKSRIIEHDLKDSEYYIRGGYDISDIEKVEKNLGNGSFLDVFI